MEWEAIGSLGELVGAAGVIFSLVYLGTQIRSSTRQSNADAIYNLQKAQSDVMEGFCADSLAKVLAKVERDEPLEPHEQLQVDFVVARVAGTFAAVQAAANNGIVGGQYLEDSSVALGIFAGRFRLSNALWRYIEHAHGSVKDGPAFDAIRAAAEANAPAG
jgi:hypothetical protein